MGADDGFEAPFAQEGEAFLQPVGGDGAAGRDDGDPGAGAQPGRPGEGRRRAAVLSDHLVSSRGGTSGRSIPNVCA